MKRFLVILFCFVAFASHSQDIDSLGIANNTMLNRQEAAFLKENLPNVPADFDFNDKLMICFYYYDNDFVPRTKIEFFAEAKNFYLQQQPLRDQLIILSPSERARYEGFDIAIVSGYPNEIGSAERKAILKHLKKLVLKVYYGDDFYIND